ncbi:RNA 2',3'-cyclic phosphodiesterase [Geodermatophilus sp. DSM 44513]|uniref:RNA 2',3'-cyclic phosphodiesterase n=1 Tax=Geodermatophilus sp. DSM 44513 TaxID=1528104 RepID=UPI0028F6C4E2|nr:RNA 2',3'-cyclic phosphodiesterase [Geodermatophilus sp. DSM 44513]WNV77829.1 RNA 2',3'-cyclic phosphodiesterase [Geodermatophilus sp. DSM 44513]
MFVAVTPPAEAVDHLDRTLAPLRAEPGAPRWTPPARWHLTLLFLGGVPADRVAGVVAAAGPAVADTPPARLRLAGAGRFGSRRRPQVLWVGVAGDGAVPAALAGRLAGAARELGLLVEDRPFRAHLTVGRWRPGRPADGDLPDRLAGYRGPPWPVTEVQLLQSHLGPEPRYEPIATWPVAT